ncbi:sequence-specific DNA binding transcription factor [Forsythia ovata]|uniref:Sequence-specific DNA binding transcription factor n=1 Tax=Forsythia ovata TaxID=205694 RepID=A0ABD1T8V2_9LAMI
MPGGLYSSLSPGMLGLEMSLQHRLPPPQNTQNSLHMPPPQHSTVGYGHQEGDYHSQNQQSGKQGYPHAAKAKNPSLTLSDDDEPGFSADDDGKKKMSPWQRMKWTDNMVRLLIMVVYYIGDEAGSDQSNDKKKGGTVLQKKGKWKSVSRAMMEKGFYVSPQQCEDKFNDLNKRYKRVNEILGKGTACRVVENQSLLDTMDHLSMKLKEELWSWTSWWCSRFTGGNVSVAAAIAKVFTLIGENRGI